MTRRRWETTAILCLFVWFCFDLNFVDLNYTFFLYAKHGGIVLRHKVQFTYRLTKRVMARYVMHAHTSYLSLSFHRKRLFVLICANTYLIQPLVVYLLEMAGGPRRNRLSLCQVTSLVWSLGISFQLTLVCFEGDPLKIDQVMQIEAAPLYVNWVDVKLCFFWLLFRLKSALTGESLPMTKGPSGGVYSGSTCKQGEIEAVVIATGVHTFFGKAAHLVDSTNQVGHF